MKNPFHPNAGEELTAYRIPKLLQKYYFRKNLFTQKSRFQRDVKEFLRQCQMDQNNTDFMNHRICTICELAKQELEEQHIQNQQKIDIMRTGKQSQIDSLSLRINELEAQIQDLEFRLAQEGGSL